MWAITVTVRYVPCVCNALFSPARNSPLGSSPHLREIFPSSVRNRFWEECAYLLPCLPPTALCFRFRSHVAIPERARGLIVPRLDREETPPVAEWGGSTPRLRALTRSASQGCLNRTRGATSSATSSSPLSTPHFDISPSLPQFISVGWARHLQRSG